MHDCIMIVSLMSTHQDVILGLTKYFHRLLVLCMKCSLADGSSLRYQWAIRATNLNCSYSISICNAKGEVWKLLP